MDPINGKASEISSRLELSQALPADFTPLISIDQHFSRPKYQRLKRRFEIEL
jgi:hypothetical protein